MRLADIILRLRNKTKTMDLIGGAAELDLAIKNTLKGDMAFVVPLSEAADKNELDLSINQRVYERFGVVLALKNDLAQVEKTGIVAFDKLHDLRGELFAALLGWQPVWAESLVYFIGGKEVTVNNAYLFYMYEFELQSRINVLSSQTDGEVIFGIIETDVDYELEAVDWNILYTNIILSPSARLPYTGDLPLDDNFPDVTLPENLANYIDMLDHPDDGDFWKSFNTAFEIYRGD